jgi:hypothetical protein
MQRGRVERGGQVATEVAAVGGERLVCATVNHALAHFDDVFVVIWRVLTTVEGSRDIERECTKFVSARPGGIGILVIVEPGALMPEAPARKAVAEFLRASSSFLHACVVVFEGDSLHASAVRSVATGLSMLARPAYPKKFFLDARKATEFLSLTLSKHGALTSSDAMLQSLARIRQLLDAWDALQKNRS